MNIVKLQDDLKNVPEQSLVGYVQNPNGQVPSYLALSELQRRKKMREQVGGAQTQSAQPSVAEQLVSEASPPPQAGIPVANVGNEEAYASGGIVAFADGGVSLYDTNKVDPSILYALERERAAKERGVWGAKLKDTVLGVTGTPSSWQYALTGGALGKPYGASEPEAKKAYDKQLELQSDKINREKYANTLLGFGPMAWYQPYTPEITEVPIPETTQQAPVVPTSVDMRVPVQPTIQDTGSTQGIAGLTKGSGIGTAAATKPAEIAGLTAPKIEYTPLSEADMTPEGNSRASMQEYKDLVGVDPYSEKSRERIGAMEAENAKLKETYPWMALAEAGFGMASGTSPNALTNIAEGGQRGVTALTRGRKEVQDQQEKIFNAEAKVAEAERALELKAAEFGVNDSRTKSAARRLEKAEDRKNKLLIDTKNADYGFEANKFNKAQQFDYDKLAMQERGQNARLAVQMKAAEKRATTEDQKLEIASLRSAVSSAQANLVSARKAYSDAIKSMDPAMIEEAKVDLTNAQQSLQYYQNLAGANIGSSSGYKPTPAQEAALSKYLK